MRVRDTICKRYSKVNVLKFRTTTLHNCTQYVLISDPVTNEIWPAELKFMTALRRKLNLPLNAIYRECSFSHSQSKLIKVLKFSNCLRTSRRLYAKWLSVGKTFYFLIMFCLDNHQIDYLAEKKQNPTSTKISPTYSLISLTNISWK